MCPKASQISQRRNRSAFMLFAFKAGEYLLSLFLDTLEPKGLQSGFFLPLYNSENTAIYIYFLFVEKIF